MIRENRPRCFLADAVGSLCREAVGARRGCCPLDGLEGTLERPAVARGRASRQRGGDGVEAADRHTLSRGSKP